MIIFVCLRVGRTWWFLRDTAWWTRQWILIQYRNTLCCPPVLSWTCFFNWLWFVRQWGARRSALRFGVWGQQRRADQRGYASQQHYRIAVHLFSKLWWVMKVYEFIFCHLGGAGAFSLVACQWVAQEIELINSPSNSIRICLDRSLNIVTMPTVRQWLHIT